MNQEIFINEILEKIEPVNLSEGIETLKIRLEESIRFDDGNGFFKNLVFIHRRGFVVKFDNTLKYFDRIRSRQQ